MTNLQALRHAYGFSVEEMAQVIGVPTAVLALAEIGLRMGRGHRERLAEFFGSQWLADAAQRKTDPIILKELGIFALPDVAIPEQFR